MERDWDRVPSIADKPASMEWEAPDDLKTKINELLFGVLPGRMTLGQFEDLAGDVYELIAERCTR